MNDGFSCVLGIEDKGALAGRAQQGKVPDSAELCGNAWGVGVMCTSSDVIQA